jgi:hypothetical protein
MEEDKAPPPPPTLVNAARKREEEKETSDRLVGFRRCGGEGGDKDITRVVAEKRAGKRRHRAWERGSRGCQRERTKEMTTQDKWKMNETFWGGGGRRDIWWSHFCDNAMTNRETVATDAPPPLTRISITQ